MTHFDNSHSVWNGRKKCPFFEVWVSHVLMQNADIWNFHGSLTLNNGKPIWYSKSLWYAIVSNIINLFVLFGTREKIPLFEVWVWSVLTQNSDIWNFLHSPTLNIGKLIWYFKRPLYAIVSNMTHFFIMFGMSKKWPFLNYGFHLYCGKIKTFVIFTAHWLWIVGN